MTIPSTQNPILANTAIRFTRKPIRSGICNSGKYMPLHVLSGSGLVLEWELANVGDGIDTTATNSQDWHVPDIRLQASVINLNSQLQGAYAVHVLSGKSLMVPSKTFTCTSSALPDSKVDFFRKRARCRTQRTGKICCSVGHCPLASHAW